MAIDKKKLQDAQDETFSGGGAVTKANKLNGKEMRIMPDVRGELDGLYFVRATTWWANRKSAVSNVTFGADFDVIEEEVEIARNYVKQYIKSPDEKKQKKASSLAKLLSKDNEPKSNVSNLIVGLFFNGYSDVDEAKPTGYKIIEGPNAFMSKINAIILGKNGVNGTPDGLLDRVKGYNIEVGVTGEKITTEYSANIVVESKNIEIPEVWYDPTKVPSLMDYLKKKKHTDAYLRAWIRNYLYGTPLLDDEEEEEEEELPRSRRVTASDVKRKPAPESDDEEEEEELPKKRSEAPALRKGKFEDAPSTRSASSRPASKGGIGRALEEAGEEEEGGGIPY